MKNFKVSTIPSGNREKVDITISGDLTIKNVGEFYKRLKEVKTSFKSYNIAIKDIQKIDVSCLQVIVAFIEDLKKNKKVVTLTQDLNEELQKLLQNADMLINY